MRAGVSLPVLAASGVLASTCVVTTVSVTGPTCAVGAVVMFCLIGAGEALAVGVAAVLLVDAQVVGPTRELTLASSSSKSSITAGDSGGRARACSAGASVAAEVTAVPVPVLLLSGATVVPRAAEAVVSAGPEVGVDVTAPVASVAAVPEVGVGVAAPVGAVEVTAAAPVADCVIPAAAVPIEQDSLPD